MLRKENTTSASRMIPEPDYYNEDDRPHNHRRSFNHLSNNNNHLNMAPDNVTDRLHGAVLLDKDGLVIPRKPVNPCVESTERRDLHRELMFHQKAGKAVLNQKSELQMALQKHKEMQIRKEADKERLASRTPLEITLEQRARRLEELERGFNAADEPQSEKSAEPNEFLRMHAKLRGRVGAAAMP